MKFDIEFEALTGLRIDTTKLRFALIELRTYSANDVLWLLLHTASRLLAADHCAAVKDYPLSSPAIKGFRHFSQQRGRIEKAMAATIDGWLAGDTLPAVPCVSLGAKAITLPTKDKLMPSGYYLISCKSNARTITVVIGNESKTLNPGGQLSVSTAEAESVLASGEGCVLRWQRQPSASPKVMPTKVLPLPKRPKPASHARDYALAVLLALLAGASFYLFYYH